jgi:type II secretory pathway pseudopilin PulG
MKKHPALTLIELLVVLAVLAVVGVPSLLAVVRFRSQQALASSAEELVGALRRAHIFSRESKDSRSWGVAYKDKGTFVLVSGTPGDFEPEGEYVLAAPAEFAGGDFAVWFDQGTGNTAEGVSVRLTTGSGQSEVTVTETGVVEVK